MLNRTLRTVSAGALLLALTACTQGAPTGATLPPLTTSGVPTTELAPSLDPSSTPSIDPSTDPSNDPQTTPNDSPSDTTPTTQTPVDITVPPEASALPLPTEQIDLPADNDQEKADRAAIEAVWREVWDLVRNGYGMTPALVKSTADGLLLDPVKTQIVNGSISGRENGRVSYGNIELAPYWYQSVGGKNVAQLGDCMDFSAFGLRNVQSGEVLTTGQANANTVGTFVKSTDGHWLLTQVTTLEQAPCSAG